MFQRDRLESFEALLPANRRRLLDIGSGPGFFLKSAASRGWNVLGVEPSRQAAAHAKRLGKLVKYRGQANLHGFPGLLRATSTDASFAPACVAVKGFLSAGRRGCW